MWKKIAALAIALCMALTLAACSGEDESVPSESASPSESAGLSESIAPTESVSPSVSASPSESVDPTESHPPLVMSPPPASTPAESVKPSASAEPSDSAAPSESMDPSVSPSPEAPSQSVPSESPADVDLAAFYSDLAASYDLGNMSQMDDETTEAHYPGLSDISTLQCLHYAPMMTGVAREITLIQVENSEDMDTVKGILQARVDAQVDGGAWYPAMIEQWQNYARIVPNGNYIMLAVHNESDAMVDAFNALF